MRHANRKEGVCKFHVDLTHCFPLLLVFKFLLLVGHKNKRRNPCSVTSPVTGQKGRSQLIHGRSDNVLPGQGYRTP
jgi:hypothetical protein